jgi:hypothetical protein
MQLVREAGVKLLLHTQVVATLREGHRICGVEVENKSGRQRIEADVTIDGTGDGDVAARGGVAWAKGRTGDGLVQSPTLVFRLGGVDRAAFIAGCKDPANRYREWLTPYPDLWDKMMRRIDRLHVIVCGGYAALVERARQAGDFNVPQTRIVGVKHHVADQFTVVMTRVLGLDPTNIQSLTDAYTRVYEQIPVLVRFFRGYVPGFARAQLLEIAPMLGVRESRRIMGDYVLTAEDLMAGRVFDDAVSMGGYHIDIHRPAGTWVDSHNVKAYTIPVRSLIARDVDGLLMARQVPVRDPRGGGFHARDSDLHGARPGRRDARGARGEAGARGARGSDRRAAGHAGRSGGGDWPHGRRAEPAGDRRSGAAAVQRTSHDRGSGHRLRQ